MTALSVVVPCRARAALLDGCLAALAGALRPGDEVVVVDAAPTSGDVQQVAERWGARRVVSGRGGASAARNAGWHAAGHELVAFVDDDCRPAAGWAAAVVAALEQLDAVCGQVRASGAGHLSVLTGSAPCDYDGGTPLAELGHGANLAARRSALLEHGGWDEAIGPGTPWPGGEDKERLARLVLAGARVGYRPEPVVEHLQWRSRRQSLRAELGYARGAGALVARGLPAGSVGQELRAAARDLRAGYEYGAVAGVVRAVGLARGRRTWNRR